MAEPPDQLPAAVGRGRLRASHADREQAIGTLKAAFIQGRLTKGELDVRVGQTLAARTYAELAAITADLPAGLAAAKPPTPARAQGGQPVLRPGPVITAATALYAGVWVYAILFPQGGDNNTDGELIFLGGLVYLIILAICVGHMAALREKRSGGQLPPPSAQRGPALEGEQSSRPGNDLILCQAPRDTRARRLLGHSVTQRIWRSVPTRRASAGLRT